MSFNNSIVEDQPHAYVSFGDGCKCSVPLNFIYKFPSKWRDEGWNKKYLYKVFWSPNDDDTPAAMLKRQPEIPVIKEETREIPGYYRASVELVKGTLQELEEELDSGKRLSIGLLRYKYTSADLGESKSQVQAASKTKQVAKVTSSKRKQDKPVILKRNKTEGKSKKKSKTPTHEMESIKDIRGNLEKQFPSLFQEELDNEGDEDDYTDSDASSAIKKVKPNSQGPLQSNSNQKKTNSYLKHSVKETKSTEAFDYLATAKASYLKEAGKQCDNSKTEGGSKTSYLKEAGKQCDHSKAEGGSKTSYLKEAGKQCDNSKAEGATIENHKSDIGKECSSDDEKDSGGDMNSEVECAEDDGEKEYETEDDKNLDVTCPVTPASKGSSRSSSRLTNAKRKILKETSSSSDEDENGSKKFKLDPDFTPRKFVKATEDIKILEVKIKRISDLNLKHQEKIINLEEENERLQRDLDLFKAKCQCKKTAQTMQNFSVNHSSTPNPSRGAQKVIWSPPLSPVRNVDTKVQEQTTEDVKRNLSQDLDLEKKQDASDNDTVIIPQEVCVATLGNGGESQNKKTSPWEGISPDLKDMIFKIPAGPKKDVKFIKELGIVLFGPETFACSSIFGTKKGAKGKDQEEKKAKPKLNPAKLDDLKVIFKQRISKEENVPFEKVEEHERYSKVKIHDTLRDAQKWCRNMGFGVGKKNNDIDADLFNVKKK